MAWERSDRREELPTNWDRLRQETLEADGHRCVWPGRWSPQQCGQPATDVDHIHDPLDHRAHNRQSLCHRHHEAKTKREAAKALREMAAKLKYPVPAKHPGLR